ncbi:hypothetical protein [Candidatus Ichthyocystis hellenicum]|uniref:hypothetical protein n=1 Tax=Candidatus Ichthyocystis hellenicum TaxID=1561003 RepID=UPI000B8962F2|nr:hypothetical protein [Candidatus Ichthyocystis hellenicum]
MYSIYFRGNDYGVDQNGFYGPSVETNLAEVVAESSSATVNLSVSAFATSKSPFLYHQLLHDLFSGNAYDINIEEILEVSEDSFLQEYELKCGYRLTEYFLSIMNKYMMIFIGKVDPILIFLSDVFSFFSKELEDHNENLIDLINKTCYSFSECIYRLMPKCVGILQSDIIPVVIKIIFDSKVIDSNHERKMTYIEMEQLFLYFVTTLEKLIMVRVMKYWCKFCNDNKSVLSSIADFDYSNPFICAYRYKKIVAETTYPAAVTNKFGEYISFMAVNKIDKMITRFSSGFVEYLKKSVLYKCYRICNYSDRVSDDIKEVREKFLDLIKEELDKKMIEERVENDFVNFLKNIVVWNSDKSIDDSKEFIFKKIIKYIRCFSSDMATNYVYDIILNFQERLSSNKCLRVDNGCLSTIEDGWGLRLHPEDSSKILSVKSKFMDRSRKIIEDKFCEMINEKYKFLDGTVIGMYCWDKISKNLFPIAQEAVRCLVDEECIEISKLLFDVRVLENNTDGSFVAARKSTSEERHNILRIYTDNMHLRNRNLFCGIWSNLVNKKDVNIIKKELIKSENDVFSAADHILVPPIDSDGSVASSSVQSELPVVTLVPVEFLDKRDSIISMWGLGLCPYDCKLISSIRKKFSSKIVSNLRILFCSMIDVNMELPSGKILCGNSSWANVSSELIPIAMNSVGSIVEEHRSELDLILSKSRVIDIDKNNKLYCVIRKVTSDEKDELMARADVFICRSLSSSITSSWVSISRNPKVYVFRKLPAVKLRRSDNVAILNTRKKYACKIKHVIHDKFSEMMKGKYKFDDGTTIGNFSWGVMSKKLFPIIKDEVNHIIDDEYKELEEKVSRARVVVGLRDYRGITEEEKCVVLDNLRNLVSVALRAMSRRVWHSIVLYSRVHSVDDNKDSIENASNCNVERVCEQLSSSVDVVERRAASDEDVKIRLSYKDDLGILSVRRKFSSEICSRVHNILSRILRRGYIFDDGTTLVRHSWRRMSGRLLPIIEKEIEPIIERERNEISDMLPKLRVGVCLSDSSAVTTRELTPMESSFIMEDAMKSVRKRLIHCFCKIWNGLIKSSSIGLVDLTDVYKSKMGNIKSEFIESFCMVLDEIFASLSPNIDGSLSSLDDKHFDIYEVVSKRSYELFKEGGFSDRVKSLLLSAEVTDSYGRYRSITDEESKIILEEFMSVIVANRDHIVKESIIKFKYTSVPRVVDLPT